MATGERAPEASDAAAHSAGDETRSFEQPNQPARGVIWGLVISVPLFWIPLILLVVYLVSRSGGS